MQDPSSHATIGNMQALLASRSPRRLQLLQAAGLTMQVQAADVDESLLPGETVEQTVKRLACLKASSVPDNRLPVIAADTLVAVGEKVLGQPRDHHDARQMLQLLSGRKHSVYSGVCVSFQGKQRSDTICTKVRFRHLDSEEINPYLKHNQVLDKAGAYALQEGASSFIDNIDGPLDNVIGLPVQRTLQLLSEVIT